MTIFSGTNKTTHRSVRKLKEKMEADSLRRGEAQRGGEAAVGYPGEHFPQTTIPGGARGLVSSMRSRGPYSATRCTEKGWKWGTRTPHPGTDHRAQT